MHCKMKCPGQNYNEYYANKRYECLKPCLPHKPPVPCPVPSPSPVHCPVPCPTPYIPCKPVCDILMKTTPTNISCIPECDILKTCK